MAGDFEMITANVGEPTESKLQQSPQPPQAPQSSTNASPTATQSHTIVHSALRLQFLANQPIEYPAFRNSLFYDPTVNSRIKDEGSTPDRLSCVRESMKMWSATGPSISARSPKTVVAPGTAFQNECFSPDKLYSSNRDSLGYEVHRSLRGTSLCSTTQRFRMTSATQDTVGPGSYNVVESKSHSTTPPSRLFPVEATQSKRSRLEEWGADSIDSREMDSAGEWKTTSEKSSPETYSFRKAPSASWIEQVEYRQRKFNPEARPFPTKLSAATMAEKRLPPFLQSTRKRIHLKPMIMSPSGSAS